jgi:polysaccharide biosynthesis transport protein
MAYHTDSMPFSNSDPRGASDAAAVAASYATREDSPYRLEGQEQRASYDGRSDNAIDLANLLAILRRRSVLILLAVLVGTGAIAFLSYSLTPIYTASAGVLLEVPKTKVINVESVLQDTTQDISSLIETKINVIESRSFAQRIILDLDLLNDPEFNEAIKNEDEFGFFTTLAGSVSDSMLASVASESAEPATAPQNQPLPDKAFMELAIKKWQEGLEVTQSGSSLVIKISYSSISPEKSARIANVIAESYVNDQLSSQQNATSSAANWLNNRIGNLRDKLVESEKAIEDYRRDNKLFNSQGVTDQRVALLSQQLADIQAQKAQQQAELNQIQRRYQSEQGGLEAIANVAQSPIIASIRQLESELLRQRAQLAEEYGPNHPKRIEIDIELKNIAEKIRVEVGHIIESVENAIQLTKVHEEKIREDLARAQELSLESNRSEVQLAFLERDAEANRQLYTAFLNRYKELGQQVDLLESNAQIISTAAIPDEPSFPRPKLMIIAGFVGSMMVGSMLAVLADMLDRGLKSPRQIEKLFAVRTLGMLPKVSLPNRRMKIHEYLLERPNSAYAEAVSAIEIALKINNDSDVKVILVTSSLPDEGKTTLAYSLATSLARNSNQTVLVDLDLRNPSLVKHMNMAPSKIGLVDLLSHRAVIADVIQQDMDSAHLDVIANPAPAINAPNMISSPVLASMIDELRRDYDYVILDSAPLVGIIDSSLIASLADVAILAIQWSKTQDDAVELALKHLRSSKVKTIGAVLTQVNMRKMQRMHYGDAAGKYHKKYSKYYQN